MNKAEPTTATEQDTSVLAGALADRALAETGDPVIALMAIFQAAAALCMARLAPSDFALAAFDGAAELNRKSLADNLGAGKIRQ